MVTPEPAEKYWNIRPSAETNLVAVDPTAHFVYVANSGDNTISGYYIHQNDGRLKPMPDSPFHGDYNKPVSLAVDPTGRFVYVANFDDNTVSGYRIEGNGTLNSVPVSTVKTAGPRSLAITPD